MFNTDNHRFRPSLFPLYKERRLQEYQRYSHFNGQVFSVAPGSRRLFRLFLREGVKRMSTPIIAHGCLRMFVPEPKKRVIVSTHRSSGQALHNVHFLPRKSFVFLSNGRLNITGPIISHRRLVSSSQFRHCLRNLLQTVNPTTSSKNIDHRVVHKDNHIPRHPFSGKQGFRPPKVVVLLKGKIRR